MIQFTPSNHSIVYMLSPKYKSRDEFEMSYQVMETWKLCRNTVKRKERERTPEKESSTPGMMNKCSK